LTTFESDKNNSAVGSGRGFRSGYLPLSLGVSMILAVSIVTASSYAQSGQGNGQQIPPVQQTSPTNPATVAKPVEKVPERNQAEPIPAVTFADKGSTTFVPARLVGQRLGLEVILESNGKFVMIGQTKLDVPKRLFAGDTLVALRDLEKLEATVHFEEATGKTVVYNDQVEFEVIRGKKRIEVDQATQELTAYEGDLVVMKTNISTGRPGHRTPNGEFKTGPVKERMHYSRKYNNAPMPYSIQVNGDVFFHGYSSVPPYPASHGCVRIPLGRKNPARYLYSWAEVGVDAKISGTYEWQTRRRKRRS
jgi:hypothetical protein